MIYSTAENHAMVGTEQLVVLSPVVLELRIIDNIIHYSHVPNPQLIMVKVKVEFSNLFTLIPT